MGRKFITYNGVIVGSGGLTLLSTETDTPPSFTNTKSIELDGIDDFVDCGDNNNLSFGDGLTDSPFSISAWIKVTTGTSFTIVGKYLAYPNGEYKLVKQADGTLLIRIISGNQELSRRGRTTNSIDSLVGQWVHVVSTYNGNSDYSGLKIYIDGVRSDVANNGKNIYNAMSNTTYPLDIGEFANTNIDEVSIFNTELSASDVTTIYNSGVPNDISSLNPLSWWRCGDGDTSPTLTDNGSGGNDGTMTNFTTFSTDVPTFNTKSILLDGVDDTINVGATPLNLRFNRLDTFSFSAWVKVDTTQNNVIIANQLAPSTNYRGYYFAVNSSNQIIIILRSTLSDRLIYTSTTTLTNGIWYHIVFTYDGTATTTGGNIYINNSLDTLTRTGTLTGTMESIDQLYLGSRDDSDNWFAGHLDEISIFNTELSASDVSTIYGTGVPNDILSISGLVSWWRCGDGDTSPTLTDNGSGGNDGTMTNFTTFSTDVPT